MNLDEAFELLLIRRGKKRSRALLALSISLVALVVSSTVHNEVVVQSGIELSGENKKMQNDLIKLSEKEDSLRTALNSCNKDLENYSGSINAQNETMDSLKEEFIALNVNGDKIYSRYVYYKEKHRECIINNKIILKQRDRYRTERNSCRDKISKLNSEIYTLEKQVSNLNKAIESCNNQLTETNQSLESCNKRNYELTIENKSLIKEINILNQKLKNCEGKNSKDQLKLLVTLGYNAEKFRENDGPIIKKLKDLRSDRIDFKVQGDSSQKKIMNQIIKIEFIN